MRNKLKILLIIIILSVTGFAACNKTSNSLQNDAIARVGNNKLTIEMLLNEIPDHVLKQDTVSAILEFRDSWVEDKTVEREAYQNKIHLSPDYKKRVERIQNQLLIDIYKEFLLTEIGDDLSVSMEEAQNYYQANKDRFVLDEKYVRFRHLTTRTRVEADNARRDLLSGREWDDVVKNYSIEPDKQLHNSEKFFPMSMAVADIQILNRYLQAIGRTEISPIANRGGYFHFVQLMEEKAEGTHPDLDWLIEQIREWLFLEKSRRFINTHIRNLYLQAEANNEIEISNVASIEEKLNQYLNQQK